MQRKERLLPSAHLHRTPPSACREAIKPALVLIDESSGCVGKIESCRQKADLPSTHHHAYSEPSKPMTTRGPYQIPDAAKRNLGS